jgi:hypothetical protein
MKLTDLQISKILADIVIVSDSREKKNKHILDYLNLNKIPYVVEKLNSGDYSFILPNYPELELDRRIVIERKGSIDELAGNFTKNRPQFVNEFERINDDTNIHMVLENFTMKKMLNGSYRSKFPSKSYMASLMTWCIRYDCHVWTVTTEESPMVIYNIIYYGLRELLK